MSIGPIEQTERAAEDSAIRFLLDGLDVESIAELKRLVDQGRDWDETLAMFNEAGWRIADDGEPYNVADEPVLGVCEHGIDLDSEFCPHGCRV